MNDISDREELLGLADQYCSGTLDDAGAERLAVALRDSADARRLFIEWMDLHSALSWNCSSVAELMEAAACRTKSFKVQSAWRHRREWALATPQRIALAVATCALVVCLVVMAMTPAPLFRPWRWGQPVEQAAVAARVTADPRSGEVLAPQLAHKVDPQYTQGAKFNGVQGLVLLSIVVGADGRAHEIEVLKSLPYGLPWEAVRAVRKWRFKPGTLDGEPVTVRAQVEVNFRLLQ